MSERKREREKKEGGKKSFNRVCQLAFPFEKVIHLTAPKMSWENKGFRRQEALQHDLQGLSDVLCVYSWLLELLFVRRLNRLVCVFDKCLSRHECTTPECNFIKAFRFVSFVNVRSRDKGKQPGWESETRFLCTGAVRVPWSIKTPRVPQANHF